MSSEKSVNSPQEMLAALGGPVRQPWEEVEEEKDRDRGRINAASGFRSKEENDRAKEIAGDQIDGPRYQYIPTPNGRENVHIDAEIVDKEMKRIWKVLNTHDHVGIPIERALRENGCQPPAPTMGDPRKAIGDALIPPLEKFAEEMRKFGVIANAGLPPSALGIEAPEPDAEDKERVSADDKEPDSDVMGYLHSAFNTAPQFLDGLYAVDRDTFRVEFDHSVSGPESWCVEILTQNYESLSTIDGDLSDAVDFAKDEIQSMLTADLAVLR